MAKINITCPTCQRDITMNAGLNRIRDYLNWYTSFYCPYCGHAEEADYGDDPPADILQAVLADEGEWALIIQDTGPLALKILRHALGLSLAEIAEIKNKLPEPIVTGPRGKMEWLQYLLAQEKIQATVIKTTGSA
jgi:hypothetical protein